MIETLPHKEPVRFIKEVEISEENDARSIVDFKTIPTLAASVEAAAQNVIFIKSIPRHHSAGFLTGMKNIKQLIKFDKNVYVVRTEVVARLQNYYLLGFVMYEQELGDEVASGQFNIIVK